MFAYRYEEKLGSGYLLATSEHDAKSKLFSNGIDEASIISLKLVCEATIANLKQHGVWQSLPLEIKEALVERFADILLRFHSLVEDKSQKAEAATQEIEKSASLLQHKARFLGALESVTPPAVIREEKIDFRPTRMPKRDTNECFDTLFKGMFQ